MSAVNENVEKQSMLNMILDYLNQNVFIQHPALLERFQQMLPSISIRAEKSLEKSKTNILGEYEVTFPFIVAMRISGDDDPDIVYRQMEDVNLFLEQAKIQHQYPDIAEHIQCVHMEMTSHPIREKTNEDGSEDYKAVFTAIIKKTSIH